MTKNEEDVTCVPEKKIGTRPYFKCSVCKVHLYINNKKGLYCNNDVGVVIIFWRYIQTYEEGHCSNLNNFYLNISVMLNHHNLGPKTNMIYQKTLNTIFRLYNNWKASK